MAQGTATNTTTAAISVVVGVVVVETPAGGTEGGGDEIGTAKEGSCRHHQESASWTGNTAENGTGTETGTRVPSGIAGRMLGALAPGGEIGASATIARGHRRRR